MTCRESVGPDTSRRTGRDRGSVLPMVLAFIVFGGISLAAISSFAITGLRTTTTLQFDRDAYYAATSALDTHIEYLRVNPSLGSSSACPTLDMEVNDVPILVDCNDVSATLYGRDIALTATYDGTPLATALVFIPTGSDPNVEVAKWGDTPFSVPPTSLFTSLVETLAVGVTHSCGVQPDHGVWCWGRNERGQLGDGTNTDSETPAQVLGTGGTGTLNAVSIAANNKQTCAVRDDGVAVCWGENHNGELGDGTTDHRNSPVEVVGPGGTGTLTDVAQLAMGLDHGCALRTDATVWCWGRNDKGQLGDGTGDDSLAPVQVVGPGGIGVLTDVVSVAADDKHTCALTTAGLAYCWGLNNEGQLGDGTTDDRTAPVAVVGVGGSGTLTDVTRIDPGVQFTCAVRLDGSALCWGRNDKGQLGDGTTDDRLTPETVVGVGGSGTLTGTTSIAGGSKHGCATGISGEVWCWGQNNRGQLGDGTDTDSAAPVRVVGPGGTGTLDGATQVAAGLDFSCARLVDDTGWCWGENGEGQLGDGTTDDSLVPVLMQGLPSP